MKEALRALYAEVDARAQALAEQHQARLQCRRGCADCCADGLTVFEVEALFIAEARWEGPPGPKGRCAFLDEEGACRIYERRPYVCRTQGLPLRWLEEEDGALAEYRDICPLNEPGPSLHVLQEEAFFTIGPFEGRLASLQAQLQKASPGAKLTRVSLRSLFEAKHT